jgi:hypothetical protein
MQVGLIGYFLCGLKTDGIFQNQAEVDAHPSSIMVEQMQTPGDLRYVDVNGDKISFDDRTDIGDPIREAKQWVSNVQLNYKGFDFLILLLCWE